MNEEQIHAMERVTENLPAGITERFKMIVGDAKRRQVVSVFAPSATRHSEYPADLPFLPDVASYVTTYPANDLPPGVRWQCADGDAAMQNVVEQSRANGWTDPPAHDVQVDMVKCATPERNDITTTFLRNGNVLRAILNVKIQGMAMVQLLDSPDAA